MAAYVARRVIMSIVVIYVVISLSFFLIRLMPGNAIQVLFNQMQMENLGLTTQQIYQRIQYLYGLQPHQPILDQYVQYVGNVTRGDLGRSILNPAQSVSHVVMDALPWTLLVVSLALLISFGLGVTMGTVMASARDSWLGRILSFSATGLSAMPNYLVALLLIYLLTDRIQLFPSTGAYTPTTPPSWTFSYLATVADHAALPVAAFSLTLIGGWALAMKGSVVSTLGNEYIRSAEARGLTKRRIRRTYIARNAMLPLYTGLALNLGAQFSSAVFIEALFQYPGIGYELVQSVDQRDYPTMMGCFIVIAVVVVASNFVIDLLYPLIDPRIARVGERRRARALAAAPTVTATALDPGPEAVL
jgi:peptide/nickel transport system permease protein